MIPAILQKDGYKADHRRQYPKNTIKVYTNFTPRKSRVKGSQHVLNFGLTGFIKTFLLHDFKTTFFDVEKTEVLRKYERRMRNYLPGNNMTFEHIEELHDLGYLPIEIKALPEGALVRTGVPILTITNTLPNFFWLPNFLETILSAELWGMCTSATTAFNYRLIFDKYALETVGDTSFSSSVQAHDFSFRGQKNKEAAASSGAAHLTCFIGTDTIPAIDYLEDYYNANSDEEVVGISVPATEHSVMCMGMKDGELATFKRLITELYPAGFVSIVSDTWDFWNVVNPNGGILSTLKAEVLARDGKVVIRPDSGDPVKIICGDKYDIFDTVESAKEHYEDWADEDATEMLKESNVCGVGDMKYICKVGDQYYEAVAVIETLKERGAYSDANYYIVDNVKVTLTPIERTAVQKGAIECLWEIFGGTINELGYKVLDPRIGLIYGDSITLERATQICEQLKAKGFASTNWVAGVGSYTYQYVTRDTYGFAMKATYGELGNPIKKVRIGEDGVMTGILDDGSEQILTGINKEVDPADIGEHEVEDGVIYVTEPREIFKDPITDDGTKKSAKGLLRVDLVDGEYILKDQVSIEEEQGGELKTVFLDGELKVDPTLAEIRARINENVLKHLGHAA